MNIFNYIIPQYFFIALIIGLIVTYFSVPEYTDVIKYPTPENAGKIIYKDHADVCYKYKANETNCPIDKSLIKYIGIQYGDNDKKNNEDIFTVIRQKIGI